jgi:hypothetical protein
MDQANVLQIAWLTIVIIIAGTKVVNRLDTIIRLLTPDVEPPTEEK